MDERFSRSEALLGAEQMARLRSSRVAVFGIGGVGGYAFEALVRTGVGEIDIFDSDKVEKSNLNRQIIATENTLGLYKVDAAKERALSINPEAKINAHKMFFSESCSDDVDFSRYDYVIDAIDTVTSKIFLVTKCNEANTKIISSMGTGNKLDPTRLEISDIYKTSVCPLARVMRGELKKRGIKSLKVLYSREEPVKVTVSDSGAQTKRHSPASVAFVPSVAGLIIAAEVIKDLIKF